MGQYFKFINVVTGIVSTAPVENNGDLPWEKNLDRGTDEEIVRDFVDVCTKNSWRIYDTIAVGDSGDAVWVDGSKSVKVSVEHASKSFPNLATVWLTEEDGEA